MISNKISSGKKDYKYFIGLNTTLHITFPKTSAYVKSYDGQTKLMYFLIKNNDLLEKYNAICYKINTDIKKEFGSQPVYNKIF